MYQVKQIVDGKEEAISVYDQAPVWINNTKSDFSNWLKSNREACYHRRR